MATNNEILNKLIATGKAQFGTYVNTGGLMVLKIPANKGVIITQMTLKAFADLPAGVTFQSMTAVPNFAWHQLRVINAKGINIFHARHELRAQLESSGSGVTVLLPFGQTQWDVFLNYENEVIFELSHAGNNIRSVLATMNTLPGLLDQTNNPNVPYGYGKTGVAGSLPALEYLTQPAEAWQVRPFNEFTQPNILSGQSSTQFQWGITTPHALNPPQPLINYGTLTHPILEVQYILYNKSPDWTFSSPV